MSYKTTKNNSLNCNDAGLPVSPDLTQKKLDKRSLVAGFIKPKDQYTIADRLEEQAVQFGDRVFL